MCYFSYFIVDLVAAGTLLTALCEKVIPAAVPVNCKHSNPAARHPRVRKTRQLGMELINPNCISLILVVVNSTNKAPTNKVNPAIRHDQFGPLRHF